MNVISSSYYSAIRKDGVCSGTLWRQKEPKTASATSSAASTSLISLSITSSPSTESRSCDYCILTGTRLECFESYLGWTKGDIPNFVFYIVGASALATDTYEIAFRLVSNQGTHLLCQATSKECRNIWLSAFQAGLELSLETPLLSGLNLQPPEPQTSIKRFARSDRRYCRSCGSVDGGTPSGGGTPVKTNSSSLATCNTVSTKPVGLAVAPLPQYGMEGKVDMTDDCATAQGLLLHIECHMLLLQAAKQEQSVLVEARRLCWDAVTESQLSRNSTIEENATEPPLSILEEATPAVDNDEICKDDTSPEDSATPQEVDNGTHVSVSPADPTEEKGKEASGRNPDWTQSPEATIAVLKLVRNSGEFSQLAKKSAFLESLVKSLDDGHMEVPDFLEDLDEATGKRQEAHDSIVSLKKQAFRVAGDMGSAMKLLLESALPETSRRGGAQDEVLICMLDFLLDLCEEGSVSTLAFFWPQLCHIHLRMLPPQNTAELRRVELVEDFLLTVCRRYSVHLALELVWSHTADLEESLSTTFCSNACRRRRFAVLRFVCELESLLFDFDGMWGGGSVSLRKMLSPTSHQVELLKRRMKQIQEMRKEPVLALSRSARLDILLSNMDETNAEEAALEKLRIARNADYFSCHLNFTRRLSDIAEKLRHMERSARGSTLEEELGLLNASGTMGGDPLNRVREDLVRVVRVPVTEGHVFRSKERTPVLLLMEILDEGAERDGSSDGGSNGSLREEQTHTLNGHSKQERGKVKNLIKGKRNGISPPPSPLSPEGRRHILESIESDSTTPKARVEEMVQDVAIQHIEQLVMPQVEEITISDKETTEMKDISEVPLEDINTEAPDESLGVVTTCDATSAEAGASTSDTNRLPNGLPEPKITLARGHLDVRRGGYDERSNNSYAPTGDIRRDVLNAIMKRGKQGDAIAAGTAISIQRSLQELERRRATELILQSEEGETDAKVDEESSVTMEALKLSMKADDVQIQPTEEDEVMESIRLLLIQNRVAQGHLSPADAAKVLQHVTINRVASRKRLDSANTMTELDMLDEDEAATVDAGDVDPRLVGCGPVPPAVLKALTLWKGGLVNNAELLELVKKDAEFVRHSVLLDVENVDKLNEDSAFWGRFAFGERWAEKKSRILATSPQGNAAGWDLQGVIVKSNDDLRQESFVMQLIELCEEAFNLAGLELWVSPYRILATGRTTGVIEMVRNAMSFDALKKRPGYGKGGLREHLRRMTEFTADPGEAFRSAQMNFVRSLAAYSLMSYLFLFKDRHNGNILLDTAGHIIHIDFGFVFGIAPGGSFSLELSTPFKLTEEMLDVMGGLRSPLFCEFVTLFCCGFLALQSYRDTFLTVIQISCEDSTFKCFEGKDTDDFLEKIRERFYPGKTKEETVAFALDLIQQSITSYGTRNYDLYQYMSQGIAS